MSKVKLTWWQKRNRAQWVRDLLSGDFKQGTNALKRELLPSRDYGYCCLGVAGERVCPRSKALIVRDQAISYEYDGPIGKRSDGFLPGRLAWWHLGLKKYSDQRAAARWNDERVFKFDRIADLVAYATENKLRFIDVEIRRVPHGYANDWLEQSDWSEQFD